MSTQHRGLLGCVLVGVIGAVGLYVLLYVLAVRDFQASNQPLYGKVEAIRRGATEAEVLQRLGTPSYTWTATTAPRDYYVRGYEFKRRHINGKVLIYLGGDMIAYIYIDRNGRVEDKFIGGS